MTISRGRWQEHLKTRGDHYHGAGRELEALETTDPGLGAGTAALAHHALAEVLEGCRAARLTRHQHILLRLGQLEARVEGAAALVRRAAAAAHGELDQKADRRLAPDAVAVASRINARDVAHAVATEGVRWIAGAEGGDLSSLEDRLALPAIRRAQQGLIADLDQLADRVYGRV